MPGPAGLRSGAEVGGERDRLLRIQLSEPGPQGLCMT
ncbi:hypothetical protein QO011_003394 [Labrys wisconsinensis]|uniref:Uncharacterized protein n=1 Tax=Labrys wisconsinensis TaxID=425677 RepID=A0ABU0J7Y6_9HYPH|nr:hypothetical protein [Labrys wisconsinensis]